MDEIKLNLVGNENDIKKEVIFNNFDVNFIPAKNLPITYYPLNNPQLSTELKTIDSFQSLSNENIDDGLDVENKIFEAKTSKTFKITKDIICDILLVGGGGGGGVVVRDINNYGGGGGGGEVIYLKDLKLKKGIYDIQIGTGGNLQVLPNSATDGKSTYLIKDKSLLYEAKGGKKGDGFDGGLSHKKLLGKGGDGNIINDNSHFGELIKNDEKSIHYLTSTYDNKNYGNGGLRGGLNDNRSQNGTFITYGNGGNGGIGTAENGIFLLKYRNNDNEFIKKYGNKTKKIDDIRSTGISVEPTKDNPNYKLLVYKNGNTNNLILNNDIVCDILLVGGGGGGGYDSGGGGGGGGGGGVYEILNYNLKTGTYSINIGAGGAGGVSVSSINNGAGSNGSNTFISSTPSNRLFEAGGGGGGGSGDIVNNAPEITIGIEGIKGSGGGAGILVTNSNNQVKNEEGITNKSIKNGGTGYTNGGRAYLTFNNKDANSWKITNGGGGGAGGNGKDGDLNKNISGDGGVGKKSQITLDYYGGGGRGGEYIGVSKRVGNSAIVPLRIAKIGDVNTGGGGGGGEHTNNGGSGGSGIVIIRVKAEDLIGETTTDFEKQFNHDTTIVNLIKNEFRTKIKIFDDINKPYNYFSIYPLVIITIIIWIFILLFLLKFLHYYFASIYIYILIIIIIFLLIFGSLWFLYTNNDLL